MICGDDTGDCDVVTELGKALINAGVRLGRGIAMLVDALLRVSMLRPSQEQTMPQPIRPRVNLISIQQFLFKYVNLYLKDVIEIIKSGISL